MIRPLIVGALAAIGGIALVAPEHRPGAQAPVAAAVTAETGARRPEAREAAATPGWRRLSTGGASCAVDVPLDVGTDVAPVTWVACTDGTPGCRQMATDWSRPGVAPFGAWNGASHDASGNARWLHFERQRGPRLFEDVVLDVTTGAPLAAFRYDMRAGCSLLPALSETRIHAVGQWDKRSGLFEGAPSALMESPASPIALPDPISSTVVSAAAASDHTVALELGLLRKVVRAPAGTNQFSALSPSALQVARPLVVGDDVFVWSEHGADGWAREYILGTDGALTPFRAAAGRHVAAMATDGATLFWTESFGGPDASWWQPSLEVWSAPYTSNPAVLARGARMLRKVDVPARTYVPLLSVAFGGVFAFQVDDSAIHLVRASDGASTEVFPGPARRFRAPLLVTPTELWALLTPDAGGGDGNLERLVIGGL